MHKYIRMLYLQTERLIVLRRPIGILVLGFHLPLLVSKMGTNQINFNQWLESLDTRPLEVISSNNCKQLHFEGMRMKTYTHSLSISTDL